LLQLGVAQDTCVDIYKKSFKKFGGTVKPDKVADLYMEYCKKNMRSSSMKSMDVVCAPLVKKVREKMMWVPPDTDVTPKLVCKSVDQIKADFAEYIPVAEENLKMAAATEAGAKEQAAEEAQQLKKKVGQEISEAMQKWRKELEQDLQERLPKKLLEVLDTDTMSEPSTKLIKRLVEAASLGVKGVETRALQKLDEALATWAVETAKLEEAAKHSEL